jgi:glucosylceramidase
MTLFHKEFPNTPLYFTEGSVFGVDGGVQLIEKLRNYASGYNAWVTILDESGKPNNGPFAASRTLITLNTNSAKSTEHFDFFLYGQFMKFVQRGATRLDSDGSAGGFANVAFRNPDGRIVLVAVNAEREERHFSLSCAGREASVRLPGGSVATFVWEQPKPK